jgi:hypothetical protein
MMAIHTFGIAVASFAQRAGPNQRSQPRTEHLYAIHLQVWCCILRDLWTRRTMR